ncbi:MAG: SAM hydrolase/SAM-dependent halogenase family protein [Candidatus Bathycorpusculaceae bacterium]
MRQLITLTTDFGLKDHYVAEMKAVILSISPDTTIIDITHDVEKFNIRMGAYILASATPYFPKGTIHLAIVDPGVGAERRPLLIQTEKSFYIGPDNGLLVLAAKNQNIKHVYELRNPRLMLPKISDTFHGRDIFAPAAAHLANGTPPTEFGPETRRITNPEFAKIVRKKNVLIAEVLHIDSFGNIITNLKEKDLEKADIKKALTVTMKNVRLNLKLCKAYSEVGPREPLAVIGSHNFLEISINQGDAANQFKVKAKEKLRITATKQSGNTSKR